jgi:hypothetical protein
MVDLVTVRLGGNAVLLGAAELAFAPTLNDPATVRLEVEMASSGAHDVPGAVDEHASETAGQG